MAGIWPNKAPFRRAARWDGAFPIVERAAFAALPAEVRAIRAYIAEHRTPAAPHDLIVHAESRGVAPATLAENLTALTEAGATCWLQTVNPEDTLAGIQPLIAAGPPSVSENSTSRVD